MFCEESIPIKKKKKKYSYPGYISTSCRFKKSYDIKAKCPKCEKIHTIKTEIPPKDDLDLERREKVFLRKFCSKCYSFVENVNKYTSEEDELQYEYPLMYENTPKGLRVAKNHISSLSTI